MDTPQGALAHVKLDATLQGTEQGKTRPILWKVYEASTPAPGNAAADVATALSRALEEIAASVAVDAGRIPPAPATPATPPLQLYSLDMTPSGKVQCNYNVTFERIQPHDSLTRADILIVRDQTTVDHYENDRWASGLAELVPEKLTAEFGQPKDGRKTVAVTGMLAGFEQVERNGGERAALVKLNLMFRWDDATTDEPALRRLYEATVPLEGDGAHAAVKGLSRALEQAAAQIATDINALQESAAP
jgi:uncharacterized lipoprotein YmbA